MRPEEQKAKWEELELRQEEELSDVVTMKMGTNAGNETPFFPPLRFFFFFAWEGVTTNPSLSIWGKR